MAVRSRPGVDHTATVIGIGALFAILFLLCSVFQTNPQQPQITQEELAQLETALAVDEDPSPTSAKDLDVESKAAQADGDPAFNFPLCKGVPTDFIPCLDNVDAIKRLKERKHYEHRERHCPEKGDDAFLDCLVPLPKGYKKHVPWPESRDQVWYDNVPHPGLASYKADQNWVKAEGQKFIFPGGGTQFKEGATKYIEWLQEGIPSLAWGKNVRIALDMGCGVASFAGYLEPFDTRVMSVAPKDEHEAQIQFALERGISAIVGVMGTKRQPYPANSYDMVHCARCRVPWHREGGKLLLELNRLIRPGGYFFWSATPVCPDCKASEPDDKEVWDAMMDITPRMCWKMVTKVVSKPLGIGVAVFQKPMDNECYDSRDKDAQPPMCADWDNANAAWYVPMVSCLHRIPTGNNARGQVWPPESRERWTTAPAWLNGIVKDGNGGNPVEEFDRDTTHWARVAQSYMTKIGIDWSTVRNVMDVDSHYGGFGASIADLPLWSMNVVPITSPDTLPIVFDRGLLGVYHDWCESFNTYPRTFDLLHCDHFLGKAIEASRCDVANVMLEFDRLLRPGGYIIIRENANYIATVRGIAKGLHWRLRKHVMEEDEFLLSYEKTFWRPASANTTSS